LSVLFRSFPDTLRHEVVGQLHAVFDSASGRSHFLTPEAWHILSTIDAPRSRADHVEALKSAFELEAEGDIDLALNTRLDELLRLGLAFPV
jgi:PqqD family protein of HPr-rel-A system